MANTTEIAEAAGVSQATVSRVINNQSGVAPETVQLVQEIIRRLGYRSRPRKTRRSKKTTERIKNVAVLLLDESCHRHPTLAMAKLRGVERALTAAGMNMILADVSSADVTLPVLERKELDGALLWGHRVPEGLMAKLQDVPTVWLSSHVSSGDMAISQGNAAVGRLACQHLLNRNFSRLCFLMIKSDHPGFSARGEGFGYAAHLAGKEIQRYCSDQQKPFEQLTSRELEEIAGPLVDQMLADKTRPIGLFLPDDQLTAAVYRRLQQANVKIGKEIEIISCNNEEPYLAGLHPRPATIDLGPELTGRRAVEQLLWSSQQSCADQRRVELVVEPILIEGESWPNSDP
ncbi:LacI family transcriptional regulator [Blastopirellula sp. J2-11]|uniref:LacI family DNA-binding transcriptional regulator n=1 Tax=Blastopirellula sp. J2-11 TaxID=2943192 RepID=UPI0021C5CAB0|nr:LacI family DNA-binding transcriptional regulator [Blastopirellula sp. J2-11]UUO07750.1 LacI family transcriptional regulator [Blastopirellula sp. J2-11]